MCALTWVNLRAVTAARPRSISLAIRRRSPTTSKVYHDKAKLSALILSGWPRIDEAEMVSRLLLPRLAEIA